MTRKKRVENRQRVHVSPCPVHSDPWEERQRSCSTLFRSAGEWNANSMLSIFSIFFVCALLDRHTCQGSYLLLLVLVRCCEGGGWERKTTEVVSASTSMYARVIGPETRPDFSCDCRPRPRLPTEQFCEHGCTVVVLVIVALRMCTCMW